MRGTGSRKKLLIFAGICMLAVLGGVYAGNRYATQFFAGRFSVQGVDVSHYQGEIDWKQIAAQGIHFAYIKATEGSGYVDERFADNWTGAQAAGLLAGAYHFFSFDSPAQSQAELYIQTVGPLEGMLVPAIDVEYYAGHGKVPDKEHVNTLLRELLELLEAHYHVKPIIYSTRTFYRNYLKGEFPDYYFWIRNVKLPPSTSIHDKDRWMFWQYTDHATLDGYSGIETYIDRDVFRGKYADLEKFTVPAPVSSLSPARKNHAR